MEITQPGCFSGFVWEFDGLPAVPRIFHSKHLLASKRAHIKATLEAFASSKVKNQFLE